MRHDPITIRMRARTTGSRQLACWLAACAALLIALQTASAQQSASPETSQAPVQAAPETPNLFGSLSRWFEQGTAGFRSHVSSARESFDDLNQRAATTSRDIGNTAVESGRTAIDAGIAAAGVTTQALGTVARLPTTRLVTGRERCQLAPNGAPDCLAAAEMLCRKQGYSTGKSLDFTSAEECLPKVMQSSRQAEDQCITVTFISRAMCQ